MPTPLRNSVQTPTTIQNGVAPQYPGPISDTAEFRADDGPLGALQTSLRKITYTLLELSVCAQDVHPPKPEDGPHGRVALKVGEVISQLSELDAMKDSLRCRIPMQVLRDIDSNRNPHLVTKDRVERAAAENQFTSGKLAAIELSDTAWSGVAREFRRSGAVHA
ncbi:hypothetical protein BS47DRAFT_296690 [Hydnum rufescens UP504]|uniref:Mediator of RNA polymerase II transcription subunit 10 n=1 Tax=Hydnum rufescens UP504 TaxID=1448309 RepID=A0A9P6DYF3_9AGAM|nr:hypothetical protein BS47DRAFT_296690 [Hydnum rufescens UP504]